MHVNQKKKTKILSVIALCVSMAFIIFLYSCDSAPDEYSLGVNADVSVEDATGESGLESQGNAQEGEVLQTDSLQSAPYDEPPHTFTPLDRDETMQLLLDAANERRLGIEKVSEDVVREIAYYRDFVFYDLTPLIPNEPQRPPLSVTLEEALEDVEIIYDVLRYVYGAYEFFGGDEVFEPARVKTVEDIMQVDGDISTNELFSIVHKYMFPLIKDFHFYLGRSVRGAPLGINYSFLVSEDIYFDKSDMGFYNRESGLYIKEIPGYDTADIMRLQLDESGQHFYAPVVVVEGGFGGTYSITVVYENGTEEQLELRSSMSVRSRLQSTSSLDIGDIPYISIEWMMGLDAAVYGRTAREYLDAAVRYRDEPIVILDLRGNMGGNRFLAYEWMRLFTGEVVRENSISFIKWNYEFEYPWAPWGDSPENNPYYISSDSFEIVGNLVNFDLINGFFVENLSDRHVVERGQVLIVLVDRHTRSAGEIFTDIALNVQNTLVIGQNTYGMLTTPLEYPNLRMPNSGITLALSREVFLHPEGHFAEGVGFAPDVWVTGDALAVTLAMLRGG